MIIMKYYIRALKNYADGDGRATRRELIWYYVFHYIIVFVLSFLDGLFGFYSTEIPLDYGYMTIIYMLATACPTICLQVRRLHDVGKSGSWWWGSKIPILCFYVLYLYLKRGDENTNEYGPPVTHNGSSKEVKSVSYTPPVHQPVPIKPVAPQPISQIPDSKKAIYCRICGTKLIEGAVFCGKCGTKVVDIPD